MIKRLQMISLRMLLGLGLLALLPSWADEVHGINIGLQTWTCRHMDFDQVIDFAVKHHIKYLQMVASHIDPNGPVEETKRKKAVLDQHGLVCYTFGVNRTSTDKEQNRKLFEFAKLMGIK